MWWKHASRQQSTIAASRQLKEIKTDHDYEIRRPWSLEGYIWNIELPFSFISEQSNQIMIVRYWGLRGLYAGKKNSAARLDPWEAFCIVSSQFERIWGPIKTPHIVRENLSIWRKAFSIIFSRKRSQIQSTIEIKKNGAARLDPWEIFLLLALKIPFHFISLRKLENYLQFYMTIVFKLNRTKKSST